MGLAGQNALGQAGLLVGRDHLVRIDAPLMPEDPIELDDYYRAREVLPPLVRTLADQFSAIVEERFFTSPAEPYTAFHGPRVN